MSNFRNSFCNTRFLLIALICVINLNLANAQNYGDLCDDINAPCNSAEKFLVCDGGTNRCSCDTDSVYSGELCQLLEGKSCRHGPDHQPCIQNSACLDDENSIESTCKCLASFVGNSKGRCFLPYGSECELRPDWCDPDEFQQCSSLNNKCECKNRNEAIYNVNEKTCQLLANATCEFEGQGCYTNSECNLATRLCECKDRFWSNRQRQCYVRYGRECNVGARECDGTGWQECDGRLCACTDITNTVYDAEIEICRKLVHTQCELLDDSQPCVRNAECDDATRECVCNNGLDPDDKIRLCYLGYNASCNSNADFCNGERYMECSANTGKCGCKYETEAVHDTLEDICKLRAEAACSDAHNAQPCVKDSRCQATEGSIPLRCKCQFNLEPNDERVCRLMHGSPCDNLNNKCDSLSYLICTDNTCQCPSNNWLDERRKCRATLGNGCNMDEECPSNSSCDGGGGGGGSLVCTCNEDYEQVDDKTCAKSYGISCDSNSAIEECSWPSHLKCLNGVCMCMIGFVEEQDVEGIKCYAGYQYQCDDTIECSSLIGLLCSGGKCACLLPTEQIFENGRCGSLVGRRCHLSSEGGGGNQTAGILRCVENATCIPNQSNEPFYGVCECNSGYLVSLTDTCVLWDRSFGVSIYSDKKCNIAYILLLTLATLVF